MEVLMEIWQLTENVLTAVINVGLIVGSVLLLIVILNTLIAAILWTDLLRIRASAISDLVKSLLSDAKAKNKK